MRTGRKRLLMISGVAFVLAPPTIALLFIAIVGPSAGLTHLHRSVAAVEARALLQTPAVLRIFAGGPTTAERAVWNELLLGFSTTQHPVVVNPRSAWLEAPKDASELFDRIVEGSPNTPGQPRATWAVHEFLLRNSQPEAIPVHRFAPQLVAVEREAFFAALNRGSGSERVAQQLGSARAFVSLSRVGFSRDGQLALIYVEVYCGALCGYGSYHVLQREEGRWRTIVEHVNWVS